MQPVTAPTAPIKTHLAHPSKRGLAARFVRWLTTANMRRMGFGKDEMTGHGFRAMARTIAHERLGIAPEVIEAQLAHKVPDALGRAYNRTLFLEQRREMMTKWADYCDRLRTGAQVFPLQQRAK